MKIYYYKSEKGNIGDDFNEWIWPKLIKKEALLNKSGTLIGIGSVLDDRFTDKNKKYVFGAGARSSNSTPLIDDTWDIYFVRGPKTAQSLKREGVKFITDPGILAGLFFKKNANANKIGIIPYYKHNEEKWVEISIKSGSHIISPHLNTEDFFNKLSECKLVITESLHGAIFSDALRIPWIPVVSYSRYAEGDTNNFKWDDWLGSLGIRASRETLPLIWTNPPKNLKEKITSYIKVIIATQKLKSMIGKNNAYLSDPTMFDKKTKEILRMINRINNDSEAAEPTNCAHPLAKSSALDES